MRIEWIELIIIKCLISHDSWVKDHMRDKHRHCSDGTDGSIWRHTSDSTIMNTGNNWDNTRRTPLGRRSCNWCLKSDTSLDNWSIVLSWMSWYNWPWLHWYVGSGPVWTTSPVDSKLAELTLKQNIYWHHFKLIYINVNLGLKIVQLCWCMMHMIWSLTTTSCSVRDWSAHPFSTRTAAVVVTAFVRHVLNLESTNNMY